MPAESFGEVDENSKPISNGGQCYNSFSTQEEAHAFARAVQNSIEPNGKVTIGEIE